MNVSLYQAAAAMNAQERWQDMISQNLAAGNLPGYRKEEASFTSVASGLDSAMDGVNPAAFMIPAVVQGTNFREGELRPTNDPMDFAVEGPGFFTVQMPDGTSAYTRDGQFQLNAKHQLVTQQGYLVMGEGGPIQFDPNSASPITVSPDGRVSQGDQTRGHLRVVQFSNPQSLTSTPDGFFLADKPGTVPVNSPTSAVRQGFLESANTSPTRQMADLISSMRMFEANSKVMQTQDQRMGSIITTLGGTS